MLYIVKYSMQYTIHGQLQLTIERKNSLHLPYMEDERNFKIYTIAISVAPSPTRNINCS